MTLSGVRVQYVKGHLLVRATLDEPGRTTFDETNLVANAGLLPAAVLAQRIHLGGLVDRGLRWPGMVCAQQRKLPRPMLVQHLRPGQRIHRAPPATRDLHPRLRKRTAVSDRRTVRAALASAEPPPRKIPVRAAPKLEQVAPLVLVLLQRCSPTCR
jgi:hypothetical protein